jgi:hypothetical protein
MTQQRAKQALKCPVVLQKVNTLGTVKKREEGEK